MTKAFFTELANRAQGLREELGDTAGIDAVDDRRKVGYIAACQDILSMDLEDVNNGN